MDIKQQKSSVSVLSLLIFISAAIFFVGQGVVIGAAARASAGGAPDRLTLKVTGKNVPRSFIYPLVLQSISENIRLQTDAQYSVVLREKEIPFAALPEGTFRELIVPVRFYGAKYKTETKKITLTVENVDVEETKVPEYLYISNSPESVRRPKIVFQGELLQENTVRFLAHHKNISDVSFHFLFIIRNPHSETVQVRIIRAPAGITSNEMRAGHYTSAHFLKSAASGTGYIREMPPDSYFLLYRDNFPKGSTLSAMCEISVVKGKGIQFSSRIMDSFVTETTVVQSMKDAGMYQTRGIYPKPFIYTEKSFEVGNEWLYTSVGENPISGLYPADGKLDGNYGVTHEIKVKVVNNSKKKERVDVYFFSAAGPASGTVLIDEKFVEIPASKSSDMLKIHTFYMLPEERREIRVVTMPEPGSFYPARIVFGARAIKDDEKTANH
ncbi:MAG: hypothetical protein AB1546_09735 [bacterium]